MKPFLLPVLLSAFFQLNAQLHNDCATALLICNKQTIHIDSVHGAGADNTELDQATCFMNGAPVYVEGNSCWIRFTVAQSGSLFYTITPDINDDIDFVFMKLGSAGDCQDKQILRCMAAGGDGAGFPSPCLGPTGLTPVETDTTGDAGCNDPDDNNFLAPVELFSGSTYALCVLNYTSLNGFRIEFCGTALLGCETEICTTIATTDPIKQPLFQLHQIYPNPVSGSTVTVELEAEKAETMDFTFVNLLGQPVQKAQRFVPAGRSTQEFQMEGLPAGVYWLQCGGVSRKVAKLR